MTQSLRVQPTAVKGTGWQEHEAAGPPVVGTQRDGCLAHLFLLILCRTLSWGWYHLPLG